MPYRPAHYLKVSTEGVRRGDFVMIAGYPGATRRIATAAEIRHEVQWRYPYAIAYYKQRYALAEKLLATAAGATRIKALVIKQLVQNVLEQSQGALAWLTRGDVLQRRQALDAKITAWACEPGRDKIKSDIGKMETILAQARATARADFDRQVALRGSRLLSEALELVRMAQERPKKDADRKPGYQDRDMPLLPARQKGFAGAYDLCQLVLGKRRCLLDKSA